jgi:4-amino-4-deoxy-L-arabinose transferase-like glycosyltransferase
LESNAAIESKREWPFLLALALMGLVIFCWRLGAPGLMDPDEGRYAEIGREIYALKDWLIPHLNNLPYLEKPPLVYWLTGLSFGALGYTELAARLPVAISALGGVFLAYGLGRAFWGPAAGFISAVVLATCQGYVVLGRILTLDMTFSLLFNLAVALGYLALSQARPRLWTWAYAALALAVLTKGPVAVVLAGIIWVIGAVFLAGAGVKGSPYPRLTAIFRAETWRPLVQPRAWLLLAAVTLPWFIYVQGRYPEFFRFFILEQHFGRYLTPAIHPEPFYYYVPVLLGLMAPWSFLLPWVLAAPRRDPQRAFLLIWAAVVLLFFSLSRGKLPPYVLPALLPLALLLGGRLADLPDSGRFLEDKGLKLSLLVWAAVGLSLTALYFWPPPVLSRALARAASFAPLIVPGLLVFSLTPLAALLWRRVGLLFLGALLLTTLAPRAVETVSLERSPRELGRLVKSHWQPGATLVGVNLYSQGLSFYSGQVFHLGDVKSELDFGRRLEPKSGLLFGDLKRLAAFAASRPRAFFYLKADDLDVLEREFPGKLQLLGRLKDCILLYYRGQ